MDRKREMKLPIYIEAAMGVFLVVILAMAGRNGMIPQNQKNNVMKQSEVEQKSNYDMQNEKEAVVEEATDSIEEVAQTDSSNNSTDVFSGRTVSGHGGECCYGG